VTAADELRTDKSDTCASVLRASADEILDTRKNVSR